MKTISIAGRLTKDAELKRTQGGDPVLQFSVAVDDFSAKEKSTLFFDVALFGKRANSLEPHLTKGSNVSVSGDFSTFNADNGKTYLKVRASEVTLQGGKRDAGQQSSKADSYGNTDEDPDSIPF